MGNKPGGINNSNKINYTQKNMLNLKVIKIILAILLLTCLFKMPYGYFQFVRLAALLGFAYLAYDANKNNKKIETYIFIGLAIVFQPLIKISLGRDIWNILDVLIAFGLIISIFIKPKINS